MDSHVLMPLLISGVLGNVVKVFPPNNNGPGHFGRNHSASEDSTSDGDLSGEGTFLVNVRSIDGFGRSLEAETNILVPPSIFRGDLFASRLDLGVLKYGLFLESLLGLFGRGGSCHSADGFSFLRQVKRLTSRVVAAVDNRDSDRKSVV